MGQIKPNLIEESNGVLQSFHQKGIGAIIVSIHEKDINLSSNITGQSEMAYFLADALKNLLKNMIEERSPNEA